MAYLGALGAARWELLCGHDVSDFGFWFRRGLTQTDYDQARSTACIINGSLRGCCVPPDQKPLPDVSRVLDIQCGTTWPGTDADPSPRTACLDAWLAGASPTPGGGGGAAPVAAAAIPGLPALPAVPGLPPSVGGISTTWLLAGAVGVVLLMVLMQK